MSQRRLRRSLFALALGAAGAAQAQSDTALPDMVVTGSRLGGLADAEPVTVLDRQALLESPHRSLGAYLQSLPFMSGAPLGTTVNRRGSGGGLSRGIETAELRGLGAERTLVLVNGRRFLPGGNGVSGLVDLAMIPVALIERIEILKTGASVEYGADAVAGVINVITRRQEIDLQLQADGGITDRGDGERLELSAVTGRDAEHGWWLAGLALADQAALGKGERGFSRRLLSVDGPDNGIVPDGSSAPPQGNFRTADGRLTLIEGEDGDSPGDFRPFIDGGPDTDRFNFNPFEDLRQQARRLSLFSSLQQRLRPGLRLNAELNWQQRESATALAPLPFFTNRLDGVSVAADNLYNPFDEELADARRRLIEAGPRAFSQDSTAWRTLLGLEGQRAGWDWELSAAFGRNTLSQQQSGDLGRDRVSLALGPSFRDAGGEARCGTPEQPVPACVPLNLFGGAGSITTAMLGYLASRPLNDEMRNTQRVLAANLRGPAWELPAGEVQTAVGYEFRRESAFDRPDPLTRAGNTTGAARSVTEGAFESHEVYAEFGVPLLGGRPGVVALDLEFGARLVDFSNFDRASVFDTALRYQPVDDVVLRLAWSRAFRAPTIAELFGGQAQSNPAVDDPCADFSQLEQAQIDRCVDQGVPADGSFDQTGNETPQLGGGNPALQPEDARILTAGVSWHPASARGLSLSLDYYAIEIDDSIAALGANTILAQCLATGADPFCGRIARDDSGAIAQVRSELQNIARETARGLDLELRYSHALPRGRLRHSLLASHVIERDLIAFPGAAPFAGAGEYDPDQFGAIPRNKAGYTLHWTLDALELGYALRWIGPLRERGGEVFPGTSRRVPSVLYHDLSLNWDPQPLWRVSLGVGNLADRDPPFLANADVANTDVATYRLLGRTLRLGVEYRF